MKTPAPDLLENCLCPVCNEEDNRPVYKVKGFQIVRCKHCFMVYVSPRLKDQSIYNIYKQNYFLKEGYTFDDYGYGNYDLTAHLRDKTFLRWYDEFFPVIKFTKGNALDVGCATGRFLKILSDKGWNAKGIELDRDIYEKLQKQGYDIDNNPLEQYQSEEQFQLITIFDVIEHLPHPNNDFKKLHQILADEGSIVLVTPDFESLQRKVLGSRWFQFKPLEHINYFSPSTIELTAKKNGFKIARIIKVGQYADLGFINHRLRRYEFAFLAVAFEKFMALAKLKKSSWYIGTGSMMVVMQKA